MKIIDTHCDVLYKLQMAKRLDNRHLSFKTAVELEANLDRLRNGGVYIQFFAIFISPKVPDDKKWEWVLEQIEMFKSEVLDKNPEVKQIKRWRDINELKDGEIGAVLSLEGAEPIGNDIEKLVHLYNEGVLSVGLTWNQSNLCADGCADELHGGLTSFGKEVVQFNNDKRILTDVSHLSVKSTWDVLEEADYVFASHSNCRALCNHPRNLYDLQLSSLFSKGSLVNITFYPPFINEAYHTDVTTINHVVKHMEHLISLGGAKQIGFGSDFDGIDLYVEELWNAACYPTLINELFTYFSYEEISDFAYRNFLEFIKRMEED